MNKIMRILFPIIAIAFGIFAIVSGVQKMQTKDQYDASTTAVIEGIEREWTGVDEDGFDEYDYKVYVTYEVDGQKYENREYPGYNSSMQKGDEIEIVYDSSNPEHFAEKIRSAVESGKYSEYKPVIAELTESGYPIEDIAAALIGMKLSKEIRAIPEFARAVPEKRTLGGRQRSVKLELSLGKRQRIAPNFILGALAEATGMPGKEFGKIDIFDSYSTVEIPEQDKDYIIKSMAGQKINGQRVNVKISESRRPFRDDRRDGRVHGRPGAGRGRNDRRSFSNKNKRHQ